MPASASCPCWACAAISARSSQELASHSSPPRRSSRSSGRGGRSTVAVCHRWPALLPGGASPRPASPPRPGFRGRSALSSRLWSSAPGSARRPRSDSRLWRKPPRWAPGRDDGRSRGRTRARRCWLTAPGGRTGRSVSRYRLHGPGSHPHRADSTCGRSRSYRGRRRVSRLGQSQSGIGRPILQSYQDLERVCTIRRIPASWSIKESAP